MDRINPKHPILYPNFRLHLILQTNKKEKNAYSKTECQKNDCFKLSFNLTFNWLLWLDYFIVTYGCLLRWFRSKPVCVSCSRVYFFLWFYYIWHQCFIILDTDLFKKIHGCDVGRLHPLHCFLYPNIKLHLILQKNTTGGNMD